MQKDKIDFIVDLLADNRIEAPLKEKVSDLATKELKRIFSVESENRERILEIEKKMLEKANIGLIYGTNEGNNIESKKQNNYLKTYGSIKEGDKLINIEKKVLIHNPRETYRLLAKFESSDGLKFLTHIYDKPNEDFNRETILNVAKDEFKEFDNDNIDYKLRNRIRAFAFSKDPKWFTMLDGKSYNSNLGWNSQEFIDWCESPLNRGSNPFDFPTFKEKMFIPFKKSIQIRVGQLPEIIVRTINKGLGSIPKNLDLDKSLGGTKFFTNVEVFESGLRYLFESMKPYFKEDSRISITVEKNAIINHTRFRILKISHIGSVCSRNSAEEILGGDLLEAKNKFTGLCNWSIQAKFDDGFFEKRILKDTEISEIESIESVEGFTHLLYFYA